MKLANATLTGERYYMTEAIRASTDGYLRLQFSDYNSARKLAKFAWKTSSQKLLFMDVTLLCLPILIEAISGPNWNEPLPIGDRKFLKQILRRSTLLYITIPNHQPHLLRVSGRAACSLGKKQKAIRKFEKAIKVAAKKGIHYQHAQIASRSRRCQRRGSRTKPIRSNCTAQKNGISYSSGRKLAARRSI